MIARDYYMVHKPKSRIADERGLSKWQVARLLREAHAKGVVRIEIRLPLGIDDVLSVKLAAALELPVIVVSDALSHQTSLAHRLCQVTVSLLADVVTEDDVVGIIAGPILREIEHRSIEMSGSAAVRFIDLQQANGLALRRLDRVSKLVVELEHDTEVLARIPLHVSRSSERGPWPMPMVIGVACGAINSSTVRAAAQRQFLASLVTDSTLAQSLLAASGTPTLRRHM
jgi:DNA-binding transcriptional regulator LsrR (DeoR family)